mmetsp:Transcript_133476/g.415078  ORF Transcript_133476/g.415078 Transcript_133476/m.415078 type:complete len:208 (+) Transcript_133476:24-647(+)
MGRRVWKVVGGGDKGGIIARDSQELGSAKLQDRLATGSLVSEEELVGERLRFLRLSGKGPERGWVSLKLGDKVLLALHSERESSAPTIPDWKGPMTEEEWSALLSPYDHAIMREGGTDAPGSHPLCHSFPKEGYFACAACSLPLFSCTAKFPDHGWPAWDKCFYSEKFGCHVGTMYDGAIENHCARCKCHLGHVFFGEHRTPTNERH